MMKNFHLFVYILFLIGCVQQPKYYASTQEINLDEKYGIKDAEAFYERNVFESSQTILIKRSYSNKEVIIKKEGFEDYHLKLESEWTDEKWGQRNPILFETEGYDISAGELFIPKGTFLSIFSVVGIIYLPWGLANDLYNIFIGTPSTVIVNPWRKIKIEDKILLKPTEDFKKQCHKRNSFISNQGCTLCDFNGKVFSSPEECDRCPNREMLSYKKCVSKKIGAHTYDRENICNVFNYCVPKCSKGFFKAKDNSCHSCNEMKNFEAEENECSKCKNRKVDSFYEEDRHYHDYCILQKCPKGHFRSNNGSCYSCTEKRTILNVDWNKCIVACPNREWSNFECRLK